MAVGDIISVLSHGIFTSSAGSCDYPSEADVRAGVSYSFGTMTGNLVLPDEAQVLLGVGYGSLGTEFTGTLSVNPQPPPTPVQVSVQGAPFAAIAHAIQVRVYSGLGMPYEFVRLVASDDYKLHDVEDFFIRVRPYAPRPTTDEGGGRIGRAVSRRVRIYIYTRSGVDPAGGDEVALKNLSPSQTVATPPVLPGQFIQEERVFNLLDDWWPLDSAGEVLTIEPLHPLEDDGPPERKPENEEGIVRSYLDFEVVYNLAIDPTDAAPQGDEE